MDKNESSSKNTALARRLYFTVCVAVVAVIASVSVAHYTSEKLTDTVSQTTQYTDAYETQQAQVEKTDVPDERTIVNNTEDDETTHQTTDEETKEQTTQIIQQTTQEETTESETKPVNKSYVLPLSGDVMKKFSLTQPQYNSTMGDWRVHSGIDFAGEEGEEVCSVGNGTVTKVYADSKWGYVIEIDYGDFVGRYCGISQDGAVGIEQSVTQGSVIGKLTTIPAEAQDGIHLHFEVLKNGENVDPLSVLG